MNNSNSYLDYWRKRQQERQKYHQHLAKEARKTLEPIITLLIEEYQVKKIILFGSLVKGNFHEESDIDLAVEGITAANYFEALTKVNRISDRWIDLKPLEVLDTHFLNRVLQTGECLYASDISE